MCNDEFLIGLVLVVFIAGCVVLPVLHFLERRNGKGNCL